MYWGGAEDRQDVDHGRVLYTGMSTGMLLVGFLRLKDMISVNSNVAK